MTLGAGREAFQDLAQQVERVGVVGVDVADAGFRDLDHRCPGPEQRPDGGHAESERLAHPDRLPCTGRPWADEARLDERRLDTRVSRELASDRVRGEPCVHERPGSGSVGFADPAIREHPQSRIELVTDGGGQSLPRAPLDVRVRADERREHERRVPARAARLSLPYPVAMLDRIPAQMPVPVARGANGAVASPHHLATEAGVGILRAGGSAVDAAIAVNAALAVVSGHSCGLGGDAFWLIHDPVADDVVALNGSGRSAAGATRDAAAAAGLTQLPERGPWTVTVPGAVDSWREAHDRFGRLAWADLLAPAIELANGFPASAGWVGAVERAAVVFGTDGDWARSYRPHGRPWRLGERVALPALARTLRIGCRRGRRCVVRRRAGPSRGRLPRGGRFAHPSPRPGRAPVRLGCAHRDRPIAA